MLIWHSESTAAVLSELGCDRDTGLSSAVAEERLRQTGQNIVGRRATRPLVGRFFALLRRPAILLLMLVAAISLAVAVYDITKYREADWITPAALLLLAVGRCAIAAFREWKADRALPTLKALAAPLVHVRRDGAQATVSSAVLVPGDIVELHAGELVPADCRLLDSFELHCDESSLTGDPLPAEKEATATATSITPLAERRNMLYAGCTVTSGQATAVVVETGSATETGKSALMRAQEKDASLPLQKGLVKLAGALAVPALAGGILATVIALVGDAPLLAALLWGFSLAAALLPEDLSMLTSPVVTATIRKMAKRGALVSRPAVAEEVGRVTVLCTNKTGSFTQNNMSLVRAFAAGRMVKLDHNRTPDDLYSLIQLSTLCCSRHPDPTEQAILHYARTHGIDPADLTASFPRLGEIPFDSDRRRMTAVHLVEGRNIVIVKGAPEDLLPLCGPLPDGVAEAEEFMGAEALRMLAVAYKEIDEAPANCYPEELECDLRFLGIIGLSDPLREDVTEAVAACRTAGIHPVLFTNESLLTAASVARRAGLLTDRSQAVSGAEIAAMSDEELKAAVPGWHVCARVSPTDKQRLVAAWQARGMTVAATGDGADDVPALRTADIGGAMARSGADVAAATADLV
ncbi:MAG: cation-transporting P-type ATPase, partial [Clostridia bacterium]|nr:cation-transporting P-type ATPase [Clostridia bacterium]